MIGILTAMTEELAPLLLKVKVIEKIHQGQNIFYVAEYKGKDLLLSATGIGKVQAAMITNTLIERFDVDCVLFSGVAGGITNGLEIGDLVIAEKLVQHDVDVTAFGHPKGHIPGFGVYTRTDEYLKNVTDKVAKENNIKITNGIIASGDKFIHVTEEKIQISKDFDAVAIEMEGASCGFVCQSHNIPCLVMRSISDTLEGGTTEFSKFLNDAADNSANLLLKIIESVE